MACFHPLPAARPRGSDEAPVIGRARSQTAGMDRFELPCGQCLGCRMDRRRMWSIRCMHEAQLYDQNLFVTCTYEGRVDPSLRYEDFQKFLKRLRKAQKGVSPGPSGKYPIRFFAAGEYGAQYKRPHFHALLFNCDFRDKERWHNGYFLSRVAEDLWSHGDVKIGTVTPESAAYCAGYTLEKVYGDAGHYEDVVDVSTGEISGRRPEFLVMSRNPGIGAWWYEKYRGDLFPHDYAVSDGRKWKVPRYYFEKAQQELDPSIIEMVKDERFERARMRPLSESSEERRGTREAVLKARLNTFNRRRL